jgi:hypothetical protein
MDQKTRVLELRMKGLALDAIHEDLVRTLGTDAVTYSRVTKYARSAKFSPKKDRPSSEPAVVEWSPVDDATGGKESPRPPSDFQISQT